MKQPTEREALDSAIAELSNIERVLNEAEVPVEDDDHIWTLTERVEWLIPRANIGFYVTRKNSRFLAEQLLQKARTGTGDSYKIKLIKALRELQDYDLRQAKDKVEELFYFEGDIRTEPIIK